MKNQEAEKEEMEKRIEEVGSYFLKTGKSTREIAKYFSENSFKISNKTVSKYIKIYQKEKGKNIEREIQEKIEENKEKDFRNSEIQKQILIELDLLFKGYRIEEIANLMNKGSSSVQRDLTGRLFKLCSYDSFYNEFYEKAQRILRENQTQTIKGNRKKWK